MRNLTKKHVQQAAWALDRFTLPLLQNKSEIDLAVLSAVVRELVAEKWLIVDARGARGRRLYRVKSKPAGDVAPRKSPQRAMWTSARKLHIFSPVDLQMHSSTAENSVSEAAAKSFVRVLLKAGYLRVIRRAIPGKQAAHYKLVRDTGPHPPVERRIVAVWDPNLDEFTYVPEKRQ